MNRQPIILISIGLVLVSILFFFGRTTESKTKAVIVSTPSSIQVFDVNHYIDSIKGLLKPSQALYINKLENDITRGDVQTQQIKNYYSLSTFWKDSVKLFEPYAFYLFKAAKLENSEKNLTFAAQIFLDAERSEHDPAKLIWETNTAIELFENALKINPENPDLKIGLGSCYIFGTGRNGDPQQTMKGIVEVLSVVRKDSTNLKAQFVLGVGGLVSGQYDKAINRFMKVIDREPNNIEAIAFLADAYAAKGEKQNAIKWYNVSKRLANNPIYSKEVDERIKTLR